MKKLLLIGVIAAILLAGIGTVSAANLVSNGGFENSGPIPAHPNFLTVPPGTLNDWTIVSGNIQVIGSKYWAPHDGSNSIDLAGTVPGVIKQSLPTVNGGTYTLSFWMAGNPDNQAIAQVVKRLEIYWDGSPLAPLQTFDATGKTRTNMGWVQVTIHGLKATSSSTVLQFENEFPNNAYGVALDDISVTPADQPIPTPEFPTAALPAALIVGLIGAVLFIQKSK